MNLIDKMDKMANTLLVIEKRLIKIVLGLGKSIIGYSILSSIYLSIYYTQGVEVTAILLAVGVVFYGLKTKHDNIVIRYELEKLLRDKNVRRD